MLSRLSRGSFWAAAFASGLALAGPRGYATVLTGIALACALLTFGLWRGCLTANRLAGGSGGLVPASRPLSQASLIEAGERLVRCSALATTFDLALLDAARVMKCELGARETTVFLVHAVDKVDAQIEVLTDRRPVLHAAGRRIRLDSSPLARAVRSGRAVIAAPEAIVLPVHNNGRVMALIELRGLQLAVESEALEHLLELTGLTLAKRAAAQSSASSPPSDSEALLPWSGVAVSSNAYRRRWNGMPCKLAASASCP